MSTDLGWNLASRSELALPAFARISNTRSRAGMGSSRL